MQLQAGIFLHSTDALHDTVFAGATVFIIAHNEAGATGFVVNQPFGRSLHELEEFRHSSPFPLYAGGPVANEELFFLHQRPALIEDGTAVAKGIYFGGNFKAAVAGINSRRLNTTDIKIFIGYCGWDAGELEAEIAEGSWTITAASPGTVFGTC